MKRTLIACALCLVASAALAQNTLKKLDMWVVLESDGSAIVGEERVSSVGTQGTEGYIAFNHLEDMEVEGLEVTDETGTDYIFENEWNTERSRSAKAGRCGFNRTSEGVEICWGLGEAGERTYNIYYRLTNLVQAFDDYDGFCFSFYEAGSAPAQEFRMHIIYEGDSLTLENAAIWAFGFEGYKAIHKGFCEIVADGQMKKGEQVVILLQLQKGLLDPVSKVGGSFTETVKRKAMEGSDYNLADAGLEDADEDVNALPEEEDTDWGMVLGIGAVVGLVGFGVWAKKREDKKFLKEHAKTAALMDTTLSKKKLDDLPYYRNPPLDGNLLLSGLTLNTVSGMARVMTAIPKLKMKNDLRQLYEAFILRMIYKGNIQVVTEEVDGKVTKLFRISEPVEPKKKGKDLGDLMSDDSCKKFYEMDYNEAITYTTIASALQELHGFINDEGIEYQLHYLLYKAAGQDHLLQPKELENYMGHPIHQEKWRPLSIVFECLMSRMLNDEGASEDGVTQVIGFQRYLKDFSLVGERNLEETGLWKEYLVFATFYGIADQVREDMKKVAPDVARLEGLLQPAQILHEEVVPLTTSLYTTIRKAHSYQTEGERSAIEARERARERSRSSGGSGRSSYGGGGGHRGGGGSGFR